MDDPLSTTTLSDADALRDLAHLTAGVAHHLINAFSAAVSGAEIQRLSIDMDRPYDGTAIADGIIETAMSASAVARRLIDATRPFTLPEPPLPIDLAQLLADFAARQRAIATPRPPVRFEVRADDPGPLDGDPAAIGALLDHLAENSVEAMPATGGTIRVVADRDDRGRARIEFRDDGSGMTPEVLERAFEPFYTTKPDRLGIGLTVAAGIWRRHQGSMTIETAPGFTRIRLNSTSLPT